jgi:hypothetical protein
MIFPMSVVLFFYSNSKVPIWTLLPWSNQIMALLHSDLAQAVRPLVLKLAKAYPQALWFAFNFVKEAMIEDDPQLEHMLTMPQLLAKLVSALQDVSVPNIRTEDFVREVYSESNPSKVPEKWIEFKKSNFGSKESRVNKAYFNAATKKELESYVNEHLDGKKPSWELNCLKKIAAFSRMSDYSEFLSTFQRSSHRETIEIPGQYAKVGVLRASHKISNPKVRICWNDVSKFSSISSSQLTFCCVSRSDGARSR